ncbi:4a-hydroxytetrahydrobiopterin dehydratase [Dolichospermum circinale CS-1225]|uniref:Putative pterin-4-alpha-carbinolamine dehydratase n=1 Tax=Dolichospermum circinale CS-537/01 TaxID=3021739 RepID=A0ABT5A2Z7_9CYAN|nr:4a-hydroxytetrahydrobiopterin dehydratase [Dolichospermum circinale]MDB9455095.1 4a-hydroxytetrahydrobiopterin dehydratase [Dolichospermum circinale CS-541/06]MDB9464538.1 4a-hydroxytetrahydrobiopterin dehydratase [Dolichospermum circinale CS-541/04]MDB9465164.1 4a-hydroxytetrahydrobiopterin dehydratase [Dolichospermum circinale CS-539/09]MDB9472829.1 4a-hydroxytetrahydrobiopterin dehydratase [Dolichospermum circinale CS-539]MDB9486083.1 4a-hydroxytetrahydrobiopterin dehydratase [Dolichospe
MTARKLSETELTLALKSLPGWQIKDGNLYKEYKFNSFATALGWMVSVGIYAEQIGHHPEWFNVYNTVLVDLTTHDIGNAISNLDVELAEKMEELASS